MRARTLILAVVGSLLLAGPAYAQSERSLFEPAPIEDAGAANPTDGGRSTFLLVLALGCVAGAGVLAGLAVRPVRPRLEPRRAFAPPAEPVREPWRPRVVSDLPPLPAFGSGSEPPKAP